MILPGRFCVVGEKNHPTQMALVGGVLIQQKNLVWKMHSAGHHGCAEIKKIQALGKRERR